MIHVLKQSPVRHCCYNRRRYPQPKTFHPRQESPQHHLRIRMFRKAPPDRQEARSSDPKYRSKQATETSHQATLQVAPCSPSPSQTISTAHFRRSRSCRPHEAPHSEAKQQEFSHEEQSSASAPEGAYRGIWPKPDFRECSQTRPCIQRPGAGKRLSRRAVRDYHLYIHTTVRVDIASAPCHPIGAHHRNLQISRSVPMDEILHDYPEFLGSSRKIPDLPKALPQPARNIARQNELPDLFETLLRAVRHHDPQPPRRPGRLRVTRQALGEQDRKVRQARRPARTPP